MYYIYCYTNKINNHKYVGQTSHVNRRKSEHKYAAFTPNANDYSLLFHKKLRQYGLDNFDFEILEEIETEDLDYVDEREQYWIKEKNSFVKNGQGYNITLGGQNKGRHKSIEREKVLKVIGLLRNTELSQSEISKIEQLSPGLVSKINTGVYFPIQGVKYPIRSNKISSDILQSVAYTLLNSDLTRQEIADMFGVSLSTVKRIKSGEKKIEGFEDSFPIRKPVSTISG